MESNKSPGMPTSYTRVIRLQSWSHLLTAAFQESGPGKQPVMTQQVESLPPVLETYIEFSASVTSSSCCCRNLASESVNEACLVCLFLYIAFVIVNDGSRERMEKVIRGQH